jgi:hypothetical protein
LPSLFALSISNENEKQTHRRSPKQARLNVFLVAPGSEEN